MNNGGPTGTSYDKGDAEPHPGPRHLPSVAGGGDGEKNGEDDGGGEARDIFPDVNPAVCLQFGHCSSTDVVERQSQGTFVTDASVGEHTGPRLPWAIL